MNQIDQPTTSHPPSLSSENLISDIPNHCCCNLISIKFASNLVSIIFAFFIITNFLVKIAGYSDLEWNWELLFLCSDSVAVACLFYGTHVESAAFFQPFIVLSLITISFLILLFIYTGTAVYDPHSYPGEYLELLLHEHLSIYAEKYHMELKNVVSMFALIGSFVILLAIFCHCWFVIIAMHCAKYFRQKSKKQQPVFLTSFESDRSIQLIVEPLYEDLDQTYTESPLQRVFART